MCVCVRVCVYFMHMHLMDMNSGSTGKQIFGQLLCDCQDVSIISSETEPGKYSTYKHTQTIG